MIRIDLIHTDIKTAVSELTKALSVKGAVALVPTETVYGLIARVDDEFARERIFELKYRDAGKVLGWFIGDWRNLSDYGVKLDGLPERLASEFCPGPLTIIAPRADGTTIGFRVPDTPLLLELLNNIKVPLIQTSANASGMPNARSCDEALAQLNGEVDCVIDGGEIKGDLTGSTVVDAVGEQIKILRQGTIDLHNWS